MKGYIDENDDYDFRTVPAASVFYPVFDQLPRGDVVAGLDLDMEFGKLFQENLPSNSKPLITVVQNTCNQVYTYEVTGELAAYLGAEDMHNPKYEDMMDVCLRFGHQDWLKSNNMELGISIRVDLVLRSRL